MARMGEDATFAHGDQVQQAVDLVRVQAGCTVEEAFVLMHERATMSGTTMQKIIASVLDESIRFG